MELLTVKDVAEELDVSPRQVARLVKAGKLQPALPVQPRQRQMFHRSAVDAYKALKAGE
jgi:excisionase family DNA binding protein